MEQNLVEASIWVKFLPAFMLLIIAKIIAFGAWVVGKMHKHELHVAENYAKKEDVAKGFENVLERIANSNADIKEHIDLKISIIDSHNG